MVFTKPNVKPHGKPTVAELFGGSRTFLQGVFWVLIILHGVIL
jgi:hypothetical protein